jgi:UDP-glucose 4-epimerase
MKMLVTGGLGHIGSSLIRSLSLRSLANEVMVIDNLASERFCSLFGLARNERIAFWRDDVRNLSPESLSGVDAIIHLAAQTDATASVAMREHVFANNLGATQHVTSLARQTGTRIVFASTTSVYGSQEARVDETCLDLLPQSPYAECKLQEETVILEAVRAGLDAIVLRLGTIAGPSPGMRFHTAVNKFCLQARLGEPLTVWETAWRQLRPYLDLEDAVRALSWAASVRTPELYAQDPVFNVVTENLSVKDIVDSIQESFGEVVVEFTESPIMNQLSYEISADRLTSLGFEASGSISDAIRRTAELLQGVSH